MSVILSLNSKRLADVQPERVSWLWQGRIPLGKLTILDGDPGNGKSTITLDLSARVSRGGVMPDGSPSDLEGPAGVLLLSAEDGLADTIRPRLDASEADTRIVYAITGGLADDGNEDAFQLPDDIHLLQIEIEATGARLVVIDPLMAFLNGETNSFRDQDVRRALAPLARLAEDTGAAIVIVRHLNKAAGGSPLYRGGGSIGIIGAARSGLLVAPDPDDDSRRVLAVTKSNLAAPVPSLAYRLEPTVNGSVRIAWDGESSHNAGQLLAGPRDDEERSARDEAKDVLRSLLEDGPVPVEDAKRALGRAGISERQWRTAKRELGVVSRANGNPKHGGYYTWQLPGLCLDTPSDQAESDQPENPRLHGQNGTCKALGVLPISNVQAENKPRCRNCGAELSTLNKTGHCGRVWCRDD